MIINHNCCIKLVHLIIFIYDTQSHKHQDFKNFVSNVEGFCPFTRSSAGRVNRRSATSLSLHAVSVTARHPRYIHNMTLVLSASPYAKPIYSTKFFASNSWTYFNIAVDSLSIDQT
jgi:hypothetical protein